MSNALLIASGVLVLGTALCVVILLVLLVKGRKGPRPGKEEPEGRGSEPVSPPEPEPEDVEHGKTPPEPPSVSTSWPRSGPALIGLTGTLREKVFPIHPAPRGLTVGRSPDNDIVISDMLAVSRYHAQVIPENGTCVLYDRDSLNGTVVNNQRVFRHELRDGDQIQIGGARLLFSTSGRIPDHIATPEPSHPTASLIFPSKTWFEGYMLERRLGEGGMSVVYKARDREGSVVALKILNVADEYAVRKFVQEQKIGFILREHPYIREVYDLGRSQQRNLYLVMEYIDGCSLRGWVGTLSDDQIVRILGQTCLALGYAHERRIVHRDVKPENILIANSGELKVTDFGIAKLTSSVTVTKDRVVGTPEYLSPEQARGVRDIKPASDIYSLGIVLYELLTGRVPFPLPKTGDAYRAAVTVLRHHVHTPPRLPREQNPDVSPDLEQVALCAMEKDPEDRYDSALAMAEALGYEEEVDHEVEGRVAQADLPQEFDLIITQGKRKGHRISVEGRSVTMGRANLDPEDSYISRQHVVISPRGDHLSLEDVSLNGTWVNGERVFGEVLLQPGDEIQIGNSVLRVTSHPQD
jgi:serine/threonine protein kinase